MAIGWIVFSDRVTRAPAPTINDQTPIQGGVLVRYDDVSDRIRYCFYILVRGSITASGQYIENWQVVNQDKDKVLAPPNAITVVVPASITDLILIPPSGASTSSEQDISLGDNPAPSYAQIVAAVSGFSASVAARFSPDTTRDVFNRDVAGQIIQAEF